MSQPTPGIAPEQVGRVTQIISGALMLGVLSMGVAAYASNMGDAKANPVISMMAAGVSAMAVAARIVVPQLMVSTQKKSLSGMAEREQMYRLAGLYQSTLIVGMALLEGPALFNLVAYMVERQVWSVGIVAILLAIMAITFPSQGKFEDWAMQLKREL